MVSSFKWIVLCVVFAAIALTMYITIDSNWSEDNDASIAVTIGFFLSALAAIMCGLKAAESNEHLTGK